MPAIATFWDPVALLNLHLYSRDFTCTTTILPKKRRGQPQEPKRRCQQKMLSNDCKSQADRALHLIAQIDVVTDGVSDGMREAFVRIAQLTACPHSHNKPGKSKAGETGAVWAAEVEAWVVVRKRELEREWRVADLAPSGPAPERRPEVDRNVRIERLERAQNPNQAQDPHGRQHQDRVRPVSILAPDHTDRVAAIRAAEAADRRHGRQQAGARSGGNVWHALAGDSVPHPYPAPGFDVILEHQIPRRRDETRQNLVDIPAEAQIPEVEAARLLRAEYETQIHTLQERVQQLELARSRVEAHQPRAAPIRYDRHPARQPEVAPIQPAFVNIQPPPLSPRLHHGARRRVRIPVPAQPQPYIPQRKAIETCFACYDDFGEGDDITWCEKQCGQNIHRECFEKWHTLNDFAVRRCAHCRAPWTEQL